jgi:hypothetical protein
LDELPDGIGIAVGQGLLQHVEGVEVDDGLYTLGIHAAETGHLQPGPRVADEDRPLDAEVVEEAADVVDRRADVVSVAGTVRASVAPAGERRDAVLLREDSRQPAVELGRAADAGEEHDGTALATPVEIVEVSAG